MNEFFHEERYLEEETEGTCRCSECKEGAVIVRPTVKISDEPGKAIGGTPDAVQNMKEVFGLA